MADQVDKKDSKDVAASATRVSTKSISWISIILMIGVVAAFVIPAIFHRTAPLPPAPFAQNQQELNQAVQQAWAKDGNRDAPVGNAFRRLNVNDSIKIKLRTDIYSPWVQTPASSAKLYLRTHLDGGATSWANVYYIDQPDKPYPVVSYPHDDGVHGNAGINGIGTAVRYVGEGVITVYLTDKPPGR